MATDMFGEYDAMRTGAAKHVVVGWGIVRVTGADAQSYLQSVLSQDLAPLGPGQGAHALLLQPQGKLDADLRVLVVAPDDVRIDCVDAPAAIASLNRFKIRVDVEIADQSATHEMMTVRGPATDAILNAELGIVVPLQPHAFVAVDDCLFIRSAWPGIAGVDVIGPIDAIAHVGDRLSIPAVGEAAFDRLRIECGVPLQGVDMDERTIPQEALLERDAISFTKGCFLGQELVCRIDSRGHVNRLLRLVTLPAVVPVGSSVEHADGDVGSLTSVAPTRDGAIALAMLRREVEPGMAVTIGPDRVVGDVLAVPGV